jgi:hypothetical protein
MKYLLPSKDSKASENRVINEDFLINEFSKKGKKNFFYRSGQEPKIFFSMKGIDKHNCMQLSSNEGKIISGA